MSDLRRRILDASIEMVAEQGVRSVSFREVARRAGVSHQAPYHHFGSYHGILHAIAQEGFGALADAMSAAAQGKGPLVALADAGIAYVEFARDHVGHFRVMFQKALVDTRDRGSPIEEAERTHGILVSLAEGAVRDGYGRGMPAPVLANVCWSTVHGFATLLVEGVLGTKQPMSRAEMSAITAQVVDGLAGLLDESGQVPRPRPQKPKAKRARATKRRA